MNQETLKALRGSIKKWKEVVAGTDYEAGSHNCPLCELSGCAVCPVMIYTGEVQCDGTPYRAWIEHHRAVHRVEYDEVARLPYYPAVGRKILCPICKVLAMKEVEFLKSLLPATVRAKSVKSKSVKSNNKGVK